MVGFGSFGSFGGVGGFGIFGFIVFLFIALIIGIFVVVLVKGLSQWRGNNQSPRLTVEAEVVSRYGDVSGDHSHTTFYVVFQVDSGDRMEFAVPREAYGFLIEGDRGKLTFQGTRYLGFERQ